MKESFEISRNRFTPEMEIFFLNAGLPKKFLSELPKILAEDPYYPCFICYGEPDRAFAEKLVTDLRSRGVACWLYPMDYTPGVRTWREIAYERRRADKMIVLCSAKSLIRDNVLKEIEEQVDEDPDKMIPISLDDLWKEEGFIVKRGHRDLKPFLLERNYVDFCDLARYEDSLDKLLKGLIRRRKRFNLSKKFHDFGSSLTLKS
jgi:hypothetical protein